MNKYYVISPNVDGSGTGVEEYLKMMFEQHSIWMGWDNDNSKGQMFQKMDIGDYVICAQGSNKQKKVFFAGKVSSGTYGDGPFKRDISGFVDLRNDGISFNEGNAYGAANRIPAIYELKQSIMEDNRICQIIKAKVDFSESMESQNNIIKLIKTKMNLVLQGAPGTGKTYITAELALSVIGAEYDKSNLMEKYNELKRKGQIEFVTFHQSMDYEDFIEGLKPSVENGNIIYKVEDGIFKKICKEAAADKDNKYVIIIDEINRGNISKIFGELISLIEADKRIGGENERPLTAKLPYSKEPFSVPDNLYIIGTMNTTDRSVGSIDYAIRRRFAFYTLKSDENIVENSYPDGQGKEAALSLYRAVKKYIEDTKIGMDVDDLMVGHSYFMYKKDEDLQQKWDYAILPLLMEYYKDGICSSAPEKDMKTFIDAHQN